MSAEFCAYYYTLQATGNPEIDSILEAVARAGKMYHFTADWDEEVIGTIQKAAQKAAGSSAGDKDWWDQNSVQCQCCGVRLVAHGCSFTKHGAVHPNTGLSYEEGEEEALCGYCAGEEVHRLVAECDDLKKKLRLLEDAKPRLIA